MERRSARYLDFAATLGHGLSLSAILTSRGRAGDVSTCPAERTCIDVHPLKRSSGTRTKAGGVRTCLAERVCMKVHPSKSFAGTRTWSLPQTVDVATDLCLSLFSGMPPQRSKDTRCTKYGGGTSPRRSSVLLGLVSPGQNSMACDLCKDGGCQ